MNLSKLPKWAQDHIALLTRQKDEVERRLADISNGFPGSRVKMLGYSHPDMTLEDRATVRFQLGEHYHEFVDVRMRDGKVELMGGNSFKVQPMASNVVEITLNGR